MSAGDWAPPGGWEFVDDFLPPGRYAFSDVYHEKVQKAQDWYEVCIACGRRTTTERGIRLVLGAGATGLVPPELYEEAYRLDNGFLGSFMVGPECGKKIPAKYRVTGPRVR